MNKLSTSLILWISAVLLASCIVISTPTTGPSNTMPRLTSSLLPTSPTQFASGPSPSTSAQPPSTATIQPLDTPALSLTATSKPRIQPHRVALDTIMPTDLDLNGVLVLEVDGYLGYLLDIQTSDKSLLPVAASGQPWLDVGMDGSSQPVSPDGRWLAYREWFNGETEDQLRIISANEQQLSLSQPEGWDHIIGWLGNESLALTAKEHPDGTVIIFNPFTGEMHEIVPSFEPLSQSSLVSWHAAYNPFALYDPTLTLVFYVESQQAQSSQVFKGILWDTVAKKKLWETSEKADYRPSWSPDGEYLAVSIGFEEYATFILNHDGHEIQRIDNLSGAPAWSLDGLQVAGYWVNSRTCAPDLPSGLAIFDLITETIDVYCVGSSLYVTLPPVWSPDGRWIAVQDEFQDVFRVIVIDLAENKAFEVTRDATVVGWMTTAP
jgi:hypothetical protein